MHKHRYHGPAFACSRPAACRWSSSPCVRDRAKRGPCAPGGLPAAPTAPCAPNSLTSRSGGRYPVPAVSCGGLVLARQMLCRNAECQRWPFLAHADGRRRQHRPQTHSAMLYRHFARIFHEKNGNKRSYIYAQLCHCFSELKRTTGTG